MNQFKEGDKVEIIEECSGTKIGTIYTVKGNRFKELKESDCACPEKWKLYKSKTTIMKKLNNMMKKLLDKDIQALVKTDFINGDLELTAKGKDALMTILFDTHRADLVKMAEEEIKEADEKDN